jgi:hypothetical protein
MMRLIWHFSCGPILKSRNPLQLVEIDSLETALLAGHEDHDNGFF